jgi:hypothetical protein
MSITTETRVPKVGDKVIATNIPAIDDNSGYSEALRRQVVTVAEVDDRSTPVRLYAEFHDPERGLTHHWYFIEWKFAEDDTDVDALRLAVSSLRTQVNEFRDSFESERRAHTATRNNFDRTMEIISNRLNNEAENRGWCDEFDRIIDDVNGDLPGPYYLEDRDKEFEVEWKETYTVTVRRSAIVKAKDAESAVDEVRDWDESDAYDIKEAIDSGNYEFESADDFEASEQ